MCYSGPVTKRLGNLLVLCGTWSRRRLFNRSGCCAGCSTSWTIQYSKSDGTWSVSTDRDVSTVRCCLKPLTGPCRWTTEETFGILEKSCRRLFSLWKTAVGLSGNWMFGNRTSRYCATSTAYNEVGVIRISISKSRMCTAAVYYQMEEVYTWSGLSRSWRYKQGTWRSCSNAYSFYTCYSVKRAPIASWDVSMITWLKKTKTWFTDHTTSYASTIQN